VQGDSVEDQAKQQTGGKQVRLKVDHTGMGTTYANAFKTNATSEEVIVDLGLNMVVPNPQGQNAEVAGDILFQVNNRLILNYYTAKRLALSLGQIVRGYEEKFGELKLNVSDRANK
tara:strand:+ start:424 stop:771 length:348 start_codon:yes stop_codon:yes gene_type:complete